MITNERQYKISKGQLTRFRQAVQAFDLDEATSRAGARALAKAELDALRSEEDVLAAPDSRVRGFEIGRGPRIQGCYP